MTSLAHIHALQHFQRGWRNAHYIGAGRDKPPPERRQISASVTATTAPAGSWRLARAMRPGPCLRSMCGAGPTRTRTRAHSPTDVMAERVADPARAGQGRSRRKQAGANDTSLRQTLPDATARRCGTSCCCFDVTRDHPAPLRQGNPASSALPSGCGGGGGGEGVRLKADESATLTY